LSFISNISTYVSLGFTKNITSSFFSYILKFTINFFLTTEIIKYLGYNNFGIFSYIVAFSSIFGGLGSLGFEYVIPTILSNLNFEEQIKYIKNSFSTVFIFGFITYLFFLLVFFFLNHEFFKYALIYGLIFPANSYVILRIYLEYQRKIRALSKLNNIIVLLISILKICIIYFDFGINYVFVISVLEPILFLLFYYFFILYNSEEIANIFRFDFSVISELLKKSYLFVFSSLIIVMYMKTDQLILRFFHGNVSLGEFTSTSRLVEIFYFIPVLLQTSYNSKYLESKNQIPLSRKKMFSITFLSFYISLFVSIFILFFSKNILLTIYGTVSNQSNTILKLYSLSFIFISLATIRNIRINALGMSSFYFKITLIGLIINLSFNIILIPKIGSIGCAIAALISQFFLGVVSSLFNPILKNDLVFFLNNFWRLKNLRKVLYLD
jgi:O-antigen/teichoic acid export membrane protein